MTTGQPLSETELNREFQLPVSGGGTVRIIMPRVFCNDDDVLNVEEFLKMISSIVKREQGLE